MIGFIVLVLVVALLLARRSRRKARQGRAGAAVADALGRRPVSFDAGIYTRTRRKDWR